MDIFSFLQAQDSFRVKNTDPRTKCVFLKRNQNGLCLDSSELWVNTLEKEMNSIELVQISCHLILIERILDNK